VARPAGALWASHNLLQPLQPVAKGWRVGPADGRDHRCARRRHPDDRQHLRSRPSAGRDGKKGGRDHCLGRSRGGLTTKIHVVVDAQGLPIRLGLTAGQAHDGQIADKLLDHLGPRTIVLADKAYDADRIRLLIEEQGATPNIPAKSNRKWKPCFSKRLYRERNLIERFFSKLKHFRRIATRYDKLAENFLAMVQLASMRLWLRAYESTA
jgi:transposase